VLIANVQINFGVLTIVLISLVIETQTQQLLRLRSSKYVSK